MQVMYLGRAPRTKETLLDFLKWRRVTRHPLVFRGLVGSQRTLGFWGVTLDVLDYTLIQVVCWVELPEQKILFPIFFENMDPDKWDTIVWYRVTRNPQEFHGLTGRQRDPWIWGVTENTSQNSQSLKPLHMCTHQISLITFSPTTHYIYRNIPKSFPYTLRKPNITII